MKHIKKVLAVIVLMSAAAACFAACGDDSQSNIPPEHTHEFSSEWKYDEQGHWHEATCEHDWLKDGEAAHSFTDSKEGEETCTEGATITRTCTCGYSYTYESEPLGHDWIEVEGKDPTCTEAGYTAYEKCSREGCNAERGKKEIPAVDHVYHYETVEEDADGNPYVDEDGTPYTMHHLVCSFCGEEKAGSLARHNYSTTEHDEETHWTVCVCGDKTDPEDHEHAPDAQLAGHDDTQHWFNCSTCGAPMEKEDHNWGEEVEEVAPDCTTAGHAAYVICEDCGYKKGGEELPSVGHKYSDEYEVDDEGNHYQICTVCDEESEHEPHEFGSAYSSDEEEHWQVCAVCGEESEHAAHTPGETFTGHDGAQHWKECTTCGNVTEAADHTWTDVEKQDPTCEEDGYTAYKKCEECGAEEGKTVLYATGHQYERKSDEEGHYMWCPVCETEQEGSRQAHTLGAYLADGTNHWQACGVCGYETTPAAHVFTNKYDKDESGHWLLCDVCGEPQPASAKQQHSYDSLGQCACGDVHTEKEYFTYTQDGSTATVTGFTADAAGKTEFAIPETYNGYTVTAIAAQAFRGNEALTKIVLPATLTTIGDFAFENCTALEEIELPASLTKIGTFDYQVFNGCVKLKSIVIPAGVTFIGGNTFKGCVDLATVTLEGVTEIDYQAFYGCTKLEGLTLEGNLTYIGQRAFAKSGIKQLTVKMAENGRIAQGAFENCEELTALSITGGVNYFASPILAGCNKLQTLTIPFVGNYNEASKATDTHFGYIFGKAAEGYAIPATLTAVNVMGGEVKEGAFDGCKVNVTAEAEVKVETVSFADYTGTFTWKNAEGLAALTGPTVEASVDNAEIIVNETATLTYTVTPAGKPVKVVITVKKGTAEATPETDYTEADGVYTFKTDGTYTITVTATYNGKTAKQDVTVTVSLPGPNLGDITVTGAENNTYYTQTEYTLNFTYTEGAQLTYTVKKGDAAASATTDYTLDTATKKITFKTAGSYTIEVQGVLNKQTQTKTVTIAVADKTATPPTIEASATTATLTEGGNGTALNVTVTYAQGDSKGSESYTVYVQEKGSENYVDAEKEWYELTGEDQKTFKAKIAGNYRITITATSANGGSASANVDIIVDPVDLTDKLTVAADKLTNGWVRVKADENADIAYTIADNTYTEGYTVSYEATNEATAQAASMGTAVNVFLAEPNTATITVIYTHKNIANKTYRFDIPVSFVTDVTSAPVLGKDPFGGTYGVIYAATGLQLYYDVTDGADGEQLALSEISFKAGSVNTTGVTLTVEHIAHDNAQPWYTITEDWTDGNKTGEVTIVLTATKNNQTAAATMKFEVKALENPNSSNGMNAYIDEVMKENGGRGALDLDSGLSRGKRENMIIAKDGIYEHRTGDGWGSTGDFFCVKVENKDNFQLDFDFKIVKRITVTHQNEKGEEETIADQKISFLVNYRGAGWNDWVSEGDTEFYSEHGSNTALSVYPSLQNTGDVSWDENGNKPTQDNTIVHLRLKHTVDESSGKVWFEWTWSYDTEYHPLYRYSATNTTDNGKNGSSIYAVCFRHTYGSVFFGNFRLTDLDA